MECVALKVEDWQVLGKLLDELPHKYAKGLVGFLQAKAFETNVPKPEPKGKDKPVAKKAEKIIKPEVVAEA